MRARLALLLPLLLLACKTVEKEGLRLSVEELSRECADTHARGTLERAEHQQLRLKLVVDSSCKVNEASMVATERYAQAYALPAVLGALVAGVVAIPSAIGAGMLATAMSDDKGARATGATIGVVPGVAAGLAVAGGVHPTEVKLEDGPPKRVEREVTSEGKRAPSGLLKVAGDAEHQWTVDEGKALLPLAAAVTVPFSALTFDGLTVELDTPSHTLASTLEPCRKALEGFKPTEAPQCPDAAVRLEAAKACNKNGWDLALPVEAKFGAVRCAPGQ